MAARELEAFDPASVAAGGLDLRTISRAALVTAAALALPVVFHALRLGSVFLPMYLPILAGACFLRPGWAAASGAASPLVSAGLTGMPPLFPPIAVWMAIELAVMAWLVSMATRRSRWSTTLAVAFALGVGRALYALLVFATGRWLELPAGALTVAALLAGWPGMILAVATVPFAVATLRRAGQSA
jgi:hypothetical protein